MASLASLLRGEREAREEASSLGLVVSNEGDVLELRDVESTSTLGFVATRVGILVYHVDAREASMETVILEDASILEGLELRSIVEDGRPMPPSVWLHSIDPELRLSRGRICLLQNGRVKCKPL